MNLDRRFLAGGTADDNPRPTANDTQVLADDCPPAGAQVTAFASTEFLEVSLGGHASIEADDARTGTESAFEGLDHGQEGRCVLTVTRQGFVAQWEAIAVDDHADTELFAIRT